MRETDRNRISRRSVIKAACAASVSSLATPTILRGVAKAQQKTLRILRWKNFVPSFETWFNETFIREWGENNDTRVFVDNVGLAEINRLAAAEAEAQDGHDLVLFLEPRAALEDYVVDHREIFEECQTGFGKPADFVLKSCYNPKTDKYHGFCESYAPTAITFRKDLWDAVGQTPATWETIIKGGRAIKFLHETPVGISMTPEHNGEHSLRAIMYAFGASVQDADGNPTLASNNSLEAIKFGTALFEETMTPEVLTWSPPSNNRFMLSGNGCLTLDTMSIIRAAENKKLPVNAHLALATLPEGLAGRIGPMFTTNTYIIWRFAKNFSGAKQFLVDYIARFKEGFIASGFQTMPSLFFFLRSGCEVFGPPLGKFRFCPRWRSEPFEHHHRHRPWHRVGMNHDTIGTLGWDLNNLVFLEQLNEMDDRSEMLLLQRLFQELSDRDFLG